MEVGHEHYRDAHDVQFSLTDLRAHCLAGNTWELSETALPHNGEAQLAEVRKPDGSSAIFFNGRTNKKGSPRGIAWSYNDGQTFTSMKFAADLSAGVSCMASVISLDEHPVFLSSMTDVHSARNTTPLLFSHPSNTNRSAGVLLRSNDAAVSSNGLAASTRRPLYASNPTLLLCAGDLDRGDIRYARATECDVCLFKS